MPFNFFEDPAMRSLERQVRILEIQDRSILEDLRSLTKLLNLQDGRITNLQNAPSPPSPSFLHNLLWWRWYLVDAVLVIAMVYPGLLFQLWLGLAKLNRWWINFRERALKQFGTRTRLHRVLRTLIHFTMIGVELCCSCGLLMYGAGSYSWYAVGHFMVWAVFFHVSAFPTYLASRKQEEDFDEITSPTTTESERTVCEYEQYK